jgi:hypothetical protein
VTLDAACAAAAATSYTDPVTWERGNCHVLLAESDGYHVIAFRGTASIADWLVDFEASPKLHAALGWCHDGFLDDVLGVSEQMLADLAGKRVVVTGHSKGGAEALIFAGLMVVAAQAPEAVVTFGAPRPAYAKLGEVLAGVAVREYRHGNDPVPEVLPEIAGWRHVREPLIQIGKPEPDAISDHFIEGYRKALVS